MSSGNQQRQGNGFWSSSDGPSTRNQQRLGENPGLLNPQLSNSILNQLLLQQQQQQQPSSSQRAEAALQQSSLLSLLPNHHANSSIFAAAVQHQLVASLANPNVSLLQTLRLPQTTHRLVGLDLSSSISLLSAGEREAMLRHLVAVKSSKNLPPQASVKVNAEPKKGLSSERSEVKPSRGSSLSSTTVAAGTGSNPAQETATQLPCQARGMPADHNSSVSYYHVF